MNKLLLLILSLTVVLVLSCQKDTFITGKDAAVHFSSDTLFFDTVFTATGSVTQAVKVINGNNQKLRLSDIKLMSGNQSYFTINTNGSTGTEQTNIELEANDSLYIFVAVRINPSNAQLPFIVQDSIAVAYNGNKKYIQLQAWGQNAHFLRNQKVKGNTVWNNTLPYVIMGGLQVDTNATLTIQQGCRIYMHANAAFLVDGSLHVQGDKYDSTRVLFLGDRLDAPYRDFPGSWPGIYFRGSSVDNVLQYAVISNAYQGIVAEGPSVNANPKVQLDKCIINNIYDAGILGAQSDIKATNCLISNCGKNIVLGYGGNYQFTFCSAVSFQNDYIAHTHPVLTISNYILQGGTPLTADLRANFLNCIFWGNYGTVEDEVLVSKQGNTVYAVNFSNCLWKVKNSPAGVGLTAIIANSDPLFDSVNTSRRYYNFHLKAASPALNKGMATSIPFDLDGNPRAVGLPDLGSYERQ
jgi:hypothetical protein